MDSPGSAAARNAVRDGSCHYFAGTSYPGISLYLLGHRGMALLGVDLWHFGAISSHYSRRLVGVPMATQLAKTRLRHRLGPKIRPERLCAFRLQLPDSE